MSIVSFIEYAPSVSDDVPKIIPSIQKLNLLQQFSFGVVGHSLCRYFYALKKVSQLRNNNLFIYFIFTIDVRFNAGQFEYLMSQKDKWSSQTVASNDAFAKWPSLLLDFLQSHINIQAAARDSASSVPKEITVPISGDPEPISITCKTFSYNSREKIFVKLHFWFMAFFSY